MAEFKQILNTEPVKYFNRDFNIEEVTKFENDVIYVDSNNFLHSIGDNAAHVTHYYSGRIYVESWYKHGKLHRFGGPAYIMYRSDQTIKKELYFLDGMEIIDPVK